MNLESLEPRLAMATGPLGTLVSVVDGTNTNLLAAKSADRAVGIDEGSQIVASVKLTRRPDAPVRVSFVSSGPLEVGVGDGSSGLVGAATVLRTPPSLVFTPSNWSVSQTLPIRAIEDGVADGNRTLPVRVSVMTGGKAAAKAIWIESRDSAVVGDVSPEPGTFTGTLDCPSVATFGPNAGSMRATFDGIGGTATFTVTSARLVNVRNRVIAVDYTIDSARKLVVEAVRGFSPQGVELDLAYQEGDEPWNRATPYLSGALTLTQSAARRSDTFIVTAAPEPEIDIQKYAGTWCEQGSVKRPATARLVNTTLVYTPQPDGSVRVWDMGWVGHVSGPKRESFGSAVPVDDTNTRWNVSVSGSSAANPRVNYWIRDFAPDYSWAIVSDASGGNGRILTRERSVETAVYEDLVRRAAFVGVRTAPITRTPQPGGLG